MSLSKSANRMILSETEGRLLRRIDIFEVMLIASAAMEESDEQKNVLSSHVERNIDKITNLKKKSELNLTKSQKIIEKIAVFFGKPSFLYGVVAFIALWLVFNLLPQQWNLPFFDPPPFEWLDQLINFVSLFMTIGVLVRQNRQEQLADQRAEIALQVNLLSEQKITKLIELVEELRKDLPDVYNRIDFEAEMMKEAADPDLLAEALEEVLEQALDQELDQELELENELRAYQS
ncbi:MAG TPA: DUF1003 domain-containing protein [Stenomitos sp.]